MCTDDFDERRKASIADVEGSSDTLPRHHRDPFDRLLVAQAQIEGLRLVTSDAKLRRYDVELIEARSG